MTNFFCFSSLLLIAFAWWIQFCFFLFFVVVAQHKLICLISLIFYCCCSFVRSNNKLKWTRKKNQFKLSFCNQKIMMMVSLWCHIFGKKFLLRFNQFHSYRQDQDFIKQNKQNGKILCLKWTEFVCFLFCWQGKTRQKAKKKPMIIMMTPRLLMMMKKNL